MSNELDRRSFLKKSLVGSASGALALSFEEKALLAQTTKPVAPPATNSADGMPTGQIGKVRISRMFAGGNLISGFAHSRDLIYVSSLLQSYFTDQKVMETLQLCEEMGINTAILRLDDHCKRILRRYWDERGGEIQWIAQIKIDANDLSQIDDAIDHGAIGVYIHGGVSDTCVENGQVDLLGKAVERIKARGVIAGIAGHKVEVPMAVVEAGIEPDFFMKTLHSHGYWSAEGRPENDNVWSRTPEKTIEFMRNVKTPWIAYKVMAAGAIHPSRAFKFAYENGADFICAGMFDFQVREDVIIANKILAGPLNRQRHWCA
jgi:hypothetical protein